jgi:glutamyl-Q tRNA(Asp) synthetase
MPEGAVMRLDMARACEVLHSPLTYKEKEEIVTVHDLPRSVGDVVLARRDMGASYHLAVVLDDADQGVTHVIRGADLAPATQIHVLLQHLLGLPTPAYHHHRLIRDATGKRLAKRDDARAIATWRTAGHSPRDIREMVGL